MRERFRYLTVAALFLSNLSFAQTETKLRTIPGKYLVILKEGSTTAIGDRLRGLVRGKVLDLLSSHGIDEARVKSIYSNVFRGFSASLSKAELALLKLDPRVLRIEADQVISVMQTTNYCPAPVSQPTELLGWGPQRIGYGGGTGKVAWVVDTGVDLCHPDLNVDKARSRSFVGTATANDDHGHGTHVAGIIGAKNNSIGMRGVASNTLIVGIKVLAANGESTATSLLSGLDYVYANVKVGEVVNLSLGGGASQAMDDAVKRIAAKGAWVVVAAGNNGANANNYSPARANATRLYTISAFGRGDYLTSWSNYGNPPVDYSAPGDNIYSTSKGGTYTRMSGTSMAAPHFSGLLLLTGGVPRSGGVVSSDKDSTSDVIAVR